jgi:hypothetical protein
MGNVSCRSSVMISPRLMAFTFRDGPQRGQERAFSGTLFLSIFLSWELTPLASSTIIEDINTMRKSGLASLAFFYCDFREEEKKDLRGLLSSLLVQLCHQSDSYCAFLSKFLSEHQDGSQQPRDAALIQCLKELLKFPGQAPVYLVLDALDECPDTSARPSPREKVLMLVEELVNTNLPNIHICVTSRPEMDIKMALGPLTFHSVSLHDEGGQITDIENYIKSAISGDPKNRRWTAEDKQMVIGVLTRNANGM